MKYDELMNPKEVREHHCLQASYQARGASGTVAGA
jgi:hypothetical protein